ncbi:MAG: hypothetical protein VXX30_08950 [Planctomycetota bacterium]|nr:hypothetical protein [Planctomycetota bacterium]
MMSSPAPTTLEAYLVPDFGTPSLEAPPGDESHVGWWRKRFAEQGGGARSLVEALTQFQVPVRTGASGSDRYVRSIRRMQPVSSPSGPGELFADADSIHWRVVDHPGGGLPVVTLAERADFELAFRALGARCEPVPVGRNVHALYVGGLPNPVRVREEESAFIEAGNDPLAWPQAMQRRMQADGTAFHDRLILLHPGPYGGLRASDVHPRMDEPDWLEASGRLRLEHEFTHHATHRLLGSYRLHVHDELLADLMGFTMALGGFDRTLFLRALGVDDGRVDEDARLHTYTMGLPADDLPALVRLLESAADRLESVSPLLSGASEARRLRSLLSLSQIKLARLAELDPGALAESLCADEPVEPIVDKEST